MSSLKYISRILVAITAIAFLISFRRCNNESKRLETGIRTLGRIRGATKIHRPTQTVYRGFLPPPRSETLLEHTIGGDNVGEPGSGASLDFRLQEISRKRPAYSGETGEVSWSRFNFSFAPGIQACAPKSLGVDVRVFRVGDFAVNPGLLWFMSDNRFAHRDQVMPSVTVGYNLRRTRIFSNTDLIVGWTPKTWIGGIRIELGEL